MTESVKHLTVLFSNLLSGSRPGAGRYAGDIVGHPVRIQCHNDHESCVLKLIDEKGNVVSAGSDLTLRTPHSGQPTRLSFTIQTTTILDNMFRKFCGLACIRNNQEEAEKALKKAGGRASFSAFDPPAAPVSSVPWDFPGSVPVATASASPFETPPERTLPPTAGSGEVDAFNLSGIVAQLRDVAPQTFAAQGGQFSERGIWQRSGSIGLKHYALEQALPAADVSYEEALKVLAAMLTLRRDLQPFVVKLAAAVNSRQQCWSPKALYDALNTVNNSLQVSYDWQGLCAWLMAAVCRVKRFPVRFHAVEFKSGSNAVPGFSYRA